MTKLNVNMDLYYGLPLKNELYPMYYTKVEFLKERDSDFCELNDAKYCDVNNPPFETELFKKSSKEEQSYLKFVYNDIANDFETKKQLDKELKAVKNNEKIKPSQLIKRYAKEWARFERNQAKVPNILQRLLDTKKMYNERGLMLVNLKNTNTTKNILEEKALNDEGEWWSLVSSRRKNLYGDLMPVVDYAIVKESSFSYRHRDI